MQVGEKPHKQRDVQPRWCQGLVQGGVQPAGAMQLLS